MKIYRNYLFVAVFIFLNISCTRTQSAKKAKKIINIGLNIGDRAPELAYSNPEGEQISLSSLRGKIVLIDFWASWCPPCRRENPKVVKAYKEYKNQKFINGKGFTIYSVSCDTDKKAWINAIKADKLDWKDHVCDLKGWEAEATYIYQIGSIPSNILIDGDGIILAKDMNGDKLSTILKGLLKS